MLVLLNALLSNMYVACSLAPSGSLFKHYILCEAPLDQFILKVPFLDFLGGTVDKNSPANAGDTGSNPGLGRSPMPRSNQAQAPQLLKPVCPRACAPRETPLQ